ncbi:hypothetical protein HMPREF9446_01367 [Bacteroides fluxus YIT 12057]|uniref:Uncharacterized protein n=1 Tax=Bacteroides fluxus YIT 12057 TaxID=763034 RepID=F3PRL6_9BACE|nr:hypothetical protein HMPREF9446_01367 [Bacteroides fluxus YIT 12057]
MAQLCQCGGTSVPTVWQKTAKNTGFLSVQEEAAVVLNFVISRSF